MNYYVAYVWGSTRAGDRNGGLGTFDTLKEAEDEAKSIVDDHTDAVAVVIEGKERSRWWRRP